MNRKYLISLDLVLPLEWYIDENGQSEAQKYLAILSEKPQLRFF